MDKDRCLAEVKKVWLSLSFWKKAGLIILSPFAFIVALLCEMCKAIKEDVVEAACKPTFTDALGGVIGLIVKYIGIVFLTALIAFCTFFILVLLLALIIEFPYISLSIFGFFALIALGVKAIRKHNPIRVEQAKKERE